MDLFVLIVLIVFIGFMAICLWLDRHDAKCSAAEEWLKSEEELLMQNDGDNPCEEGQSISVSQRFCESQCWIIGDRK